MTAAEFGQETLPCFAKSVIQPASIPKGSSGSVYMRCHASAVVIDPHYIVTLGHCLAVLCEACAVSCTAVPMEKHQDNVEVQKHF